MDGSGGAGLRGGNWNNGTNAGVFTLNLNNAPSNTNTNIGFRCAWAAGG
jgi:formylglycine-generating enzyme required for sulfatase activity